MVVSDDYPPARLFLRLVYLLVSLSNSSPSGNTFMKYAYKMLSRIYLIHEELQKKKQDDVLNKRLLPRLTPFQLGVFFPTKKNFQFR